MKRLLVCILAATAALADVPAARAEANTVTIVEQIGLTSLSIMVMDSEKLVEKHAVAAGLGKVTARYVTVSGASQVADVLLSRTADIVLMGFPTLAKIWSKTAGTSNEIKGLSATLNMPFFLTTRNPTIHTLADFTNEDRIAVPAVKISTMALLLQMAAAKQFGLSHYDKLDSITVQMSHPSAVTALLSKNGPVDAHVATAPFYQEELKDPAIHIVFKSYDIVGGPHNNGVLGATRAFYRDNPRLAKAILAAQTEANSIIKHDPRRAAQIYLRMSNDKRDTLDGIVEMVSDPDIDFTTVPTRMQQFADFMYHVGLIPKAPASWKDLYFDSVNGLPGN
jgi:NitT/TauT family transport system substrate-binding protein